MLKLIPWSFISVGIGHSYRFKSLFLRTPLKKKVPFESFNSNLCGDKEMSKRKQEENEVSGSLCEDVWPFLFSLVCLFNGSCPHFSHSFFPLWMAQSLWDSRWCNLCYLWNMQHWRINGAVLSIIPVSLGYPSSWLLDYFSPKKGGLKDFWEHSITVDFNTFLCSK